MISIVLQNKNIHSQKMSWMKRWISYFDWNVWLSAKLMYDKHRLIRPGVFRWGSEHWPNGFGRKSEVKFRMPWVFHVSFCACTLNAQANACSFFMCMGEVYEKIHAHGKVHVIFSYGSASSWMCAWEKLVHEYFFVRFYWWNLIKIARIIFVISCQ